ncbi:MAG: M23 family metallopeptidase [Parvibaculum sp.]|uniref:M23 family metallopeptidase n=1 Tax=Parvibaculum sp. TaxID=2024848 RepID=UPI00326327CB
MSFMSRGFTLLLLGAGAFVLLDEEARLSASGIVTDGYAYVAGYEAPLPLERPPLLALADLDDCLRGTGRVNGADAYAAFCTDLANFAAPETAVAEGDAVPVEPPEREDTTTREVAQPLCAASIPPVVRSRGKTSEVVLVPQGCNVPSPADGKVLYAGFFKGYLGVIILEMQDETRLTIAGLGNVAVRRGDDVMAGNEIGTTPDTVAPALADAADGSAALLLVADATVATPAS